ncbi:hypothetical protein EVAR_64243_1 [Eumeta japonica]|uniref:Uncharacterized protein n=1 Tax=Eumeta variegata TaxID=151549 RepID=A0A4C1ZBI5_EUMVA|nr:hypothetical protein EVAR_64243_1 [Eumeta japonica]
MGTNKALQSDHRVGAPSPASHATSPIYASLFYYTGLRSPSPSAATASVFETDASLISALGRRDSDRFTMQPVTGYHYHSLLPVQLPASFALRIRSLPSLAS